MSAQLRKDENMFDRSVSIVERTFARAPGVLVLSIMLLTHASAQEPQGSPAARSMPWMAAASRVSRSTVFSPEPAI